MLLSAWACFVVCPVPSLAINLAVLSEGPCVLCVLQLGSVACSPVDCPITCTYPFHPDGECCPVCHGEWEKPPVPKAPRWTRVSSSNLCLRRL